jgi:hypothetical protein
MAKNRPKISFCKQNKARAGWRESDVKLEQRAFDSCDERAIAGKSQVVIIQTAPGAWS